MKRGNFPNRKAAKKAAAEVKQEQRANLTAAEQIKVLDSRLGVGVGAVKERRKLAK